MKPLLLSRYCETFDWLAFAAGAVLGLVLGVLLGLLLEQLRDNRPPRKGTR